MVSWSRLFEYGMEFHLCRPHIQTKTADLRADLALICEGSIPDQGRIRAGSAADLTHPVLAFTDLYTPPPVYL